MYTSKLTWLSTLHTASHRNPQRIILNKKKMNSWSLAFAFSKNNPYLCENDEEKLTSRFTSPPDTSPSGNLWRLRNLNKKNV